MTYTEFGIRYQIYIIIYIEISDLSGLTDLIIKRKRFVKYNYPFIDLYIKMSAIDLNSDIEESIADNIDNIEYYEYEYSDFKIIQEVEVKRGAFGNVVRANWESRGRVVALKSFVNNDKITVKKEVLCIALKF